MESYPVSVDSILEELGASVSADGEWALDQFNVGDEVYRLSSPAEVRAQIINGGSGLVASGTVTANVNATCARCLCEFTLTIAADIEGFYVQPGHDADLPEEQEVEFISAEKAIDLAPAMHAALVLEAPFAPLHDPDCAGICVKCGTDLNTGICGCSDEAPDTHPFSALKDFDWNEASENAPRSDQEPSETDE
jgi:uncharacterized protein